MWIEMTPNGWPNNFTVMVRLFDRQGGRRVDGEVEFKVQRGDDDSTRGALTDHQNNPVVAQVTAAQDWVSPEMDYSQAAQQGYDTLVAVCEGRAIKRWLTQPQRRRDQQPNQPAANNPRQANNVSYELRLECGTADHKGIPIMDADNRLVAYKVPILISVVKVEDKKRKPPRNLRFRLIKNNQNSLGPAEGFELNEDGNFRYTLQNIDPGGGDDSGIVFIKCRVFDPRNEEEILAEKTLYIEVPKVVKTKDQPKPKALTVAHGDPKKETGKHTYIVFLTARDHHNKLIGVGDVQWECGGKVGTVDCSSGIVQATVELTEPGEHLFTAKSVSTGLAIEPIKLQGPEARKVVEASTRLKVDVEGHVVNGARYIATLPIATLDKFGVANSDIVKVQLTKGSDVEFIDRAAGNPVAGSNGVACQITSSKDGNFFLDVDFNGQMQVEVDVIYPDAKQKQHFVLQYPL